MQFMDLLVEHLLRSAARQNYWSLGSRERRRVALATAPASLVVLLGLLAIALLVCVKVGIPAIEDAQAGSRDAPLRLLLASATVCAAATLGLLVSVQVRTRFVPSACSAARRSARWRRGGRVRKERFGATGRSRARDRSSAPYGRSTALRRFRRPRPGRHDVDRHRPRPGLRQERRFCRPFGEPDGTNRVRASVQCLRPAVEILN